MKNEFILAQALLESTEVSLLDAARFIRNILDAKCKSPHLSDALFCAKIIEIGKRHIRISGMTISEGFALYLESKRHLRPESFSDIRYLGNRLLKAKPELAARNFSELTLTECEEWLAAEFKTPSQFNKARTMLHGLFEFALRREWCDKNIVKLIEKHRVIEKEIKPLTLQETKKLLKTSQLRKYRDCTASIGLLIFAGIRPREVRRLEWRDIDLEENSITIRSQCSKTGGVRQVEICPALKNWLIHSKNQNAQFAENRPQGKQKICPKNFNKKWKIIRDISGFKGIWVQDVLRHTYASHHAKRFKDLPRLQLNMGHRDQSLLRSRYINMTGITTSDARDFFDYGSIKKSKMDNNGITKRGKFTYRSQCDIKFI